MPFALMREWIERMNDAPKGRHVTLSSERCSGAPSIIQYMHL
jgi:hypothetical protein